MVSPSYGRLAGRIGVDRVDDGLPLSLLVDLAEPSAGLPVRRLTLKILLILIHIVHLRGEERNRVRRPLSPHHHPPTTSRCRCVKIAVGVRACLCVCGGAEHQTPTSKRDAQLEGDAVSED